MRERFYNNDSLRGAKQKWSQLIAHPENYNLHKNEEGNLVGVDVHGSFTRILFSTTERRQHMATIRQEIKGVGREVDFLYKTNSDGETAITAVRNVRLFVPNNEGELTFAFNQNDFFVLSDTPYEQVLPVIKVHYWDGNEARRGKIDYVDIYQQQERELLSLSAMLKLIEEDNHVARKAEWIAGYLKQQYQMVVSKRDEGTENFEPFSSRQLMIARQAAEDLLAIFYTGQTPPPEGEGEEIISAVPPLPASVSAKLDELGLSYRTTMMIVKMMQEDPQIQENLTSLYQQNEPLTPKLHELFSTEFDGELLPSEDPHEYGPVKELLKLLYFPYTFKETFLGIIMLGYQEYILNEAAKNLRISFSNNRPSVFSTEIERYVFPSKIGELMNGSDISAQVSDAEVRLYWDKTHHALGVRSKNPQTERTRLVVLPQTLPKGFQEVLWKAGLSEQVDYELLTKLPESFNIFTQTEKEF
jgi:hypothetical protein